MLVDARELTNGQELAADVCIIGAGPAGITLATELSHSDIDVVLLESGEWKDNAEAQGRASGRLTGDIEGDLASFRRRQVAGTSNDWRIRTVGAGPLVRYMPLSEADFSSRTWVPESGWPLSLETLQPYYARALQDCGVSNPDSEGAVTDASAAAPLHLPTERFTNAVFQFAPAARFREQAQLLAEAIRVRLITNATALELLTEDDGLSVRQALVAGGNARFKVRARTFVLAGGGIENARLLLLSRSGDHGALGNAHGLVGRYFMEHPLVHCARLVPFQKQAFQKAAFYDLRLVRGAPVMGHLVPTPSLMEEHGLLNSSIWLFPRPVSRGIRAIEALPQFARSLSRRQARTAARAGVHILAGLDYISPALWSRIRSRQPLLPNFGWGGWSHFSTARFQSFDVFALTEQAPDWSNQVMLSNEVDDLGQPRANVRWHWGSLNARSLQRTVELLGQELSSEGIGKVGLFGEPAVQLSHHHMGTTRMHSSPRKGVVDAECRVHNVSNLYAAGSSVFPSSGYANPTLTIAALSLRLAEHLRRTLAPAAIS